MAAHPLELKMCVLSEEDEQADLMFKIDRHLNDYPELAWVYHVPNGMAANGFYYTGSDGKRKRACPEGKKMKRLGVKQGVPDLALDNARGNFLGLRIEMKRTNASPSDVSKEQREWHTHLRGLGFAVFVCKGCAAAWYVLMWYMNLPSTVLRDAPDVSQLPPTLL